MIVADVMHNMQQFGALRVAEHKPSLSFAVVNKSYSVRHIVTQIMRN
jgi:hypothetical protein